VRYWLIAAVLLYLCQTGQGQDRVYQWSVASVVAANTVDVHSSWGKYEANPLLGSGRFGARQLTIKSGIIVGWQFAAWAVTRHNPKARRRLAWLNIGAAAAISGVAIRNYTIQRGASNAGT